MGPLSTRLWMFQNPLGTLKDRDDFGSRLRLVKIVGPLLHHLLSFGEVCGAVVGAPVGIAYSMGQLVFDVIGADCQHFIQNRSRYRSKSVPTHLLLADPHAPH